MAKGLDGGRVAIHFAYVILAVWVLSFLLDIMLVKFEPPVGLHAIMMATVTGIFGREVFKKDSNHKEDSTK